MPRNPSRTIGIPNISSRTRRILNNPDKTLRILNNTNRTLRFPKISSRTLGIPKNPSRTLRIQKNFSSTLRISKNPAGHSRSQKIPGSTKEKIPGCQKTLAGHSRSQKSPAGSLESQNSHQDHRDTGFSQELFPVFRAAILLAGLHGHVDPLSFLLRERKAGMGHPKSWQDPRFGMMGGRGKAGVSQGWCKFPRRPLRRILPRGSGPARCRPGRFRSAGLHGDKKREEMSLSRIIPWADPTRITGRWPRVMIREDPWILISPTFHGSMDPNLSIIPWILFSPSFCGSMDPDLSILP